MTAPRLGQTTLEFAIRLSERAGTLAAERFFAADFALAIKADGTEVTDADLAVETLIRGELAARFRRVPCRTRRTISRTWFGGPTRLVTASTVPREAASVSAAALSTRCDGPADIRVPAPRL
ncbi:hypothetical protein Nm8I071_36750 [Nonomuraea sp. TT08I-71]|nr:hypothetical protein Nm8I071_36750 [Nonomuraea sp. TT08I-71]